MRCAAFFPALHGYQLSDPRVDAALHELSSRQGCAAFVHCGLLRIGIRKKLGLPSEFDVGLSIPLDVLPLALKYSTLPVIIPHLGAGYFREALMVAASSQNIYLDTSSSNQWMAIEVLNLTQVFTRALAVVGAERLLFGTDSSFFPRGWNGSIFDQQMEILKALAVPHSALERIFRRNFVEIFQLG